MKTTAFSRRPKSESRGTDIVRMPLGRQLLDAGKLTEHDVNRIVQAQLTTRLRFGETAVQLGLLSYEELQLALALQYSYPCLAGPDSGLSRSLYAANQPFDRQSEALRSLRSQLLMRWFSDRRKSIALTSVDAGGSSAGLAANLAVSLAQLGERILLIDANLRDPRQHLLFGLESELGLSSLLSHRCEIEDVLVKVPAFDNLAVICAGAVPPNPQELLSRVPFSYLLETVPTLFDLIVIDTPPILKYADGQLIATLVGGCVLTTRRHRTRVCDVDEVKRQLQGSRAEIVGAVVLD